MSDEISESTNKENARSNSVQKTDCSEQSALATSAEEQSIENFIETYHAIAEWIRFADAKAAVILTVGGALAGFLIPTVQDVINSGDSAHLIPHWREIGISLFAVYAIFFLLSGIYAFICINPITEKGKHPSLNHCDHFHPAAISVSYRRDDVTRFVEDCDRLGAKAMKREVQAAVLLDSHVSSKKYRSVKKSLMLFAISVFFGFLYFLVAQL